MDMEYDALPCPMCKSENLTIFMQDKPYPNKSPFSETHKKGGFMFEKSHYVECKNCGVRTKQFDKNGSLSKALKCWNMRDGTDYEPF